MVSPLRRIAAATAILIVPGWALAETPAAGPGATGRADASTARQSVSVFLGASRWSGDFGATENSTISAVLPTLSYRQGGLRLAASLPWMRIDSGGAIFTGIDGAPLIVSPDARTSPKVRDGLGDLTLSAAYLLPATNTVGVDVDLVAKVKLPTGSTARGVSTGKTDYAVGAEFSKKVGAFTPSAAVRYRGFGNAKGWRLKDGFAASVGGAYELPHDFVVLISYEYAQAASSFIDDSHELLAGISAPLGRSGLRATSFISGGLSNGASDVSGGLSLAASF